MLLSDLSLYRLLPINREMLAHFPIFFMEVILVVFRLGVFIYIGLGVIGLMNGDHISFEGIVNPVIGF